MLSRFISSMRSGPVGQQLSYTVEGVLGLGTVGLSHQFQQLRFKSVIKRRGYLEHADFKKKDVRWHTATWHDPKRMSYRDFECRRWRALLRQKAFPLWQAKMDYAENLVRIGMPSWTIQQICDLHPHCIDYLERKIKGEVVQLRLAHYSNYVNHQSGVY